MKSNIEQIKGAISELALGGKIYNRIHLTVDEQTNERDKPKRYLELTLDLFKAIGGQTIVELGCMRKILKHPISELNPECCNDGHSTYVWASSGAQVYSVDISLKSVLAAKWSCRKLRHLKITWGDGINYLEQFDAEIDLLYLDAWDVAQQSTCAEMHLLAYLSAKPKLSKRHIVAIDDTDIGDGGKGRLLIPRLEADDYEILVKGRQTIALLDT